MKKLSGACALVATILFTGCQTHSNTVWEDTKTMGRYLQRKGQSLWKNNTDSRMIESEDEFVGPQEEEYVPLKDEDLKTEFADHSIPQPKEVPGALGSSIPSIDQFITPTSHLANLFQTLYFNTDEHTLKAKDDYKKIADMAEYMKKNSNLYIFVAGHCDERASEAYNLALGTRRANTIRTLFVKRGVNPNHIYTISFGKEMPADLGHTAEVWAKNRRVEFKIFEKKDS
ncbi:MAG: OmpA family protein [Simkaniaceae bacterium]|nr:OmpA family protein [Simkaniaceae bacterium]